MFSKTAAPVTKEYIEQFETEAGIHLPVQMKDFYLQYNGGKPVRACFYEEAAGSVKEIAAFYSFKHQFNENVPTLETSYATLLSRNNSGVNLLPFAYDWGSNRFCINLETGQVVLVLMDLGEISEKNKSIRFMAGDFNEFIAGLVDCPEEEDV